MSFCFFFVKFSILNLQDELHIPPINYESIITKAQQTVGEIESFEDKLTVIKQKVSDIFKYNHYFVNEKKRMRKRQYDNKWKSEKRRKVSKLHDNVFEFENVCKDLFNRLGGKFLFGEYDAEMGVFQIA